MTARALIVQPRARRDIARAAAWYERESDGLGSRFLAVVDAALSAVARDGDRYPTVFREVRRIRLDAFPYGLYFVLRDGAVQVLAVTHGRRHPSRWQRRAPGS